MKHLLTALVLTCSFALVGCGGGGGTPGDAVKDLTYAMEAGDAEKVKELVPELSENLGDDKIETLVKQAAKEAEANGGVKSITTDKEEIDGDKATVTATMVDGNGNSETDEFELVKKDGKWVHSMGDLKGDDGGIELSPDDIDIEEPAE